MARLDLGWKNDKRKQNEVRCRKWRAAVHRLNELRPAHQAGLPIKIDERQTVTQFRTRWLDDTTRHTLQPNGYNAPVDLHISPAARRTTLTNLTPQNFFRLYAAILDKGLTPRRRG